jgi:glycosyltransferase involved in cell wall biosynthesis
LRHRGEGEAPGPVEEGAQKARRQVSAAEARCQASAAQAEPTVCLAMIVRNEAPVIGRCLASVLALVDRWVIVDTGSTDGTQQIVAQLLCDLRGQLIERPWVDFAHNRNEALRYAAGRCDYVLVIDADEVLEVGDDFCKGSLTAEAYYVEVRYANIVYRRKQILRSDLPWRYEGALHEHARCEQPTRAEDAVGLRIDVHRDGARARDPNTYRRDALILESALLDEPDNARNVFYLAQSYRDAGDFELAIRHYHRRVEMGGWGGEIWYSLYQIAYLRERMGHPWEAVMQDYLRAFQYEPLRAEPLLRIAARYQGLGESHTALVFLAQAIRLGLPSREHLFVESDVYEYRLALEYAAACCGAGEHVGAITACNELLRCGSLPAEWTDHARQLRQASLAQREGPRSQPCPARLRVCLPFRDPGHAFDDCVESLLHHQSTAAFDVTLIDDASRSDHGERLVDGGEGWGLIRNHMPVGLGVCVDRFVAEQCEPDDVVVVLARTRGLADAQAVSRVLACFEDERCQLLYGQHRLASGHLGDAIPAASEGELTPHGPSLTSRSTVFFRARLWTDARSAAVAHAGAGAGGVLQSPTTGDLLRAAGLCGIRFIETALTVVDDEPASSFKPQCHPRVAPGQDALKVSCLMVTGERVALAKRAIRCFAEQTFPNRELVIVSDAQPRVRLALERFVAALGLEDVRFVAREGSRLTLGALRNLAMDAATGEIVCQWDDDDCYHPERIRAQVEEMLSQKGRACLLTDHLQYLEGDHALLWIDWRLGGLDGDGRLMPGSLMMFKDERFRYPEAGESSRRGEDSVLLSAVYDTVPVVAVEDLGHLYLYTHHGRNTFDEAHHRGMGAFSRSVSDMRARRDVIRRAMVHYPVPKPYFVLGRDGPAFVLGD